MWEGHDAVDELVAECEKLATPIQKALNGWGVESAADSGGELQLINLDEALDSVSGAPASRSQISTAIDSQELYFGGSGFPTGTHSPCCTSLTPRACRTLVPSHESRRTTAGSLASSSTATTFTRVSWTALALRHSSARHHSVQRLVSTDDVIQTTLVPRCHRGCLTVTRSIWPAYARPPIGVGAAKDKLTVWLCRTQMTCRTVCSTPLPATSTRPASSSASPTSASRSGAGARTNGARSRSTRPSARRLQRAGIERFDR